MFSIEKSPAALATGHDKCVMDSETGAWIQRLSGMGPTPYASFKLEWEDRVIPFEARKQLAEPEGGAQKLVWTITKIGASEIAKKKFGILPFQFNAPEEKEKALELCANALLVFGNYYNGLTDELIIEVHYDGGSLTTKALTAANDQVGE